MGCFVFGFPTHIAGLKFEYIWTYPTDSRYVGIIDSPGIQPVCPKTFDSAMKMLSMLLKSEPFVN